MNRYQYLEQLDRMLSSLPYDQRREIMYDYEEHFKEAMADGQDEESIIERLGPPEKVASQYATVLAPIDTKEKSEKKPESFNENRAQQTKTLPPNKPNLNEPRGNSSAGKFIIAMFLIMFNFLFVIWLYIGHWCVLFGLTLTGIVLVVAGIVVIAASFVTIPISIPFQQPLLIFLTGLVLICVGGLMLIVLYYIIRLTCFVTAKYVKWNMHLVRGY